MILSSDSRKRAENEWPGAVPTSNTSTADIEAFSGQGDEDVFQIGFEDRESEDGYVVVDQIRHDFLNGDVAEVAGDGVRLLRDVGQSELRQHPGRVSDPIGIHLDCLDCAAPQSVQGSL